MPLRTAITRAAVLVAALSLGVSACSSGAEPVSRPSPTPTKTRTPVNDPAKLTFGVWGGPTEVEAYQQVVSDYNSATDLADVTLKSWSDDASMMRSIAGGDAVPDVFLVSRGDLQQLWDDKRVEPVDSYLDARAVDIGDEYSRDALEAFSSEHHLQCMPYAVSPRVIYYNTDLVDFPRMKATGLDVPGAENKSWSLEQFETAATFGTTVRRGVRGFAIDPTVSGLAPFIYSGGGQVFDDEDAPTSLAFSEGDSVEAIERTLEVLRRPQLTLNKKQLAERTPLQWFERGELGMIAGYRRLVPQLRQVHGLDFDVISMPILDGLATWGDITGLCLSADAASTPAAADLMVQMLDTPAVERVVRAGYLVPANSEVALSDDFLQPGRLPEHSDVFNNSTRAIQIPPLLSVWPELEQAVRPELELLVDVPVLDDLEERLADIDEESRPVLQSDNATPTGE